jgi:alpha-glucosidase
MPQLANLGLSGVSFTGADIGGFGGNANAELFARWIELGFLYPFARGHSAMNTQQKEPWMFGRATEEISRHYLSWRYRLLPYLYTAFWQSCRTGVPVWQPLLYQFPDDHQLAELHDQVFVGEALMLAPIYRPGQEYRHVYLPASNFYNFWDGTPCSASQHLLVNAPLDSVPLFGKGGTVVPLGPAMEWSEQRPLDKLTLEVYTDAQGAASGQLYEDDGTSYTYQQGGYSLTRYECKLEAANTHKLIAKREGQFQPTARSVEVRVHTPHGLKTANLDQDSGNWELSL